MFEAFTDLEKAYDRVDMEAMWRLLQMYAVNGRQIEARNYLYIESKGCVKREKRVMCSM